MIELHIEKLTHGGRGMGRLEGKAVFVPLTCPGDRVRCKVTRDKGRFAEAELVEVVEPSLHRREPPCPLFGQCGGCQWQHLPYPLQGEWKARIFSELLTRRQLVDAERIGDLMTAPQEFAYRSRVQFKCHATSSGVVLGFFRPGSHFVVDAERCLLVAAPIQNAFVFLRQALQSVPVPEAIPQVDIGCDAAGTVEVIVHVLPAAANGLRPWLEESAKQGGFNAFLQSGRKQTVQAVYGSPGLIQSVGSDPLQLQAGPGCFTQVNPEQNSRMVDHVLKLADLQGNERVLDLFCGIGNFSLPLARRSTELVGVEDYAPSIAYARQNAIDNGIANAEFFVEDARGAALRHQKGRPFDLVLLDPPRSGCYDVIKDLLQVMPPRVIYISCDPATLARDLQLMAHNDYVVTQTRPVDLFPQTWHIESVTLLKRRD